MTTDNKTLADVQPGGRVMLGDQAERARFEAWARELLPCPFCGNSAEFVPYKDNGLTLKCKSMGCIQRNQRTLRYGIDWLRTSMTEHWNARVLSAQPSPGGQDVLFIEELAELRRLVPSVNQKQALDAAIAALAARQPVGKPVAHRLVTGDPKRKWMVVQGAPSIGVIRQAQDYGWEIECFYSHTFKPTTPSWATRPAQGVDLDKLRALADRWATDRSYSGSPADDLRAWIDSQAVGNG